MLKQDGGEATVGASVISTVRKRICINRGASEEKWKMTGQKAGMQR